MRALGITCPTSVPREAGIRLLCGLLMFTPRYLALLKLVVWTTVTPRYCGVQNSVCWSPVGPQDTKHTTTDSHISRDSWLQTPIPDGSLGMQVCCDTLAECDCREVKFLKAVMQCVVIHNGCVRREVKFLRAVMQCVVINKLDVSAGR